MCFRQIRRFKCTCFNITTGINESKILAKHISCKCEYKFDGKKCISNQKWNNDYCLSEYKNLTCSCENGKQITSIIENSVITCVRIVDTTKRVPIKTVPAKSTSKNFYILLISLLITMVLVIVVNIYCCFIKYPAKHKYLLLCYVTNKLRETLY